MIRSENKAIDFQMLFSDGTREAFSDATPEHGGSGEGFSPHDLLEAALANCIGITVRMYAMAHALPLAGVKVAVSLDRSDKAKAEFKYSLELEGALDAAQKEKIMRAAKACSVHKTLMRELVFTLVEAL